MCLLQREGAECGTALRPAVRRAVDSSSVTSDTKVLFSWSSFQGMLMLLIYYNIIIPGALLYFSFLILLCLLLLFKKGVALRQSM